MLTAKHFYYTCVYVGLFIAPYAWGITCHSVDERTLIERESRELGVKHHQVWFTEISYLNEGSLTKTFFAKQELTDKIIERVLRLPNPSFKREAISSELQATANRISTSREDYYNADLVAQALHLRALLLLDTTATVPSEVIFGAIAGAIAPHAHAVCFGID